MNGTGYLLSGAYYNNESILPLLFAQHNEHRPVFPNIILLMFAVLTNWNIKAEMIFSGIICLLNFILVWKISVQTKISSKFILIPVSFLMFSLGQWQNILWGWQLQWYLAMLGILSGVYFLEKTVGSIWYILPAIIGGVLASFSLNNGLLIWPLGLFQLWLIKKDFPWKIKSLLIWLFTGFFIFILYYMDYAKPSHHPSFLLFIEQPETFLQCWFANLGFGLGGENIPLSIFMGAVILVSFIVFFFLLKSLNKEKLRQLMPWIILGLFSLISITLISAARLGLGLNFAVASRYVTISSILVIATLILCITALTEAKNNIAKRKILIALSIFFLTVLTIGSVITLLTAWQKGEKVYLERMKVVVYLNQYEYIPDNCITSFIFPRPHTVRAQTSFLKEKKLSLFRNQTDFNLSDYKEMTLPADTNTGLIDGMELIPPQHSNGKDTVLHIRGWAIDPVTKKKPKGVFVFWDGRLLGRAFMGDYRPDIARLFRDNELKTAGWEIFVPLKGFKITNGVHNITARILLDGQNNYYCDILRQIKIEYP